MRAEGEDSHVQCKGEGARKKRIRVSDLGSNPGPTLDHEKSNSYQISPDLHIHAVTQMYMQAHTHKNIFIILLNI